MKSKNDLKAAIKEALEIFGVKQTQPLQLRSDKAYEAYIFSLCLRAAQDAQAKVRLCNTNGQPKAFVLRGAPGKIYSKTSYGYASIELGTRKFEIHIGIEIQGTSTMTHELDVCIIRAHDANKCRQASTDPKHSCLRAAWECKFYSGTLDKNCGRAFVGLLDDMKVVKLLCKYPLNASQAVQASLYKSYCLSLPLMDLVGKDILAAEPQIYAGLCSNVGNQQLDKYFRSSRRPEWHPGLSPANGNEETRFLGLLKDSLSEFE